MRSANSCPTRTGRTKACSPSRTMTSSGCALRYDLTAPTGPLSSPRHYDAPAETLSQLSRRLGVPQREAWPRPLPPVHAVRRRHGGLRRSSAADAEMCDDDGRRDGERSVSSAATTSSASTTARCWTAFMEAIGLGGDENAGRRLTVLRAIDKLDKLGPEGVRLLLGLGVRMAARTRAATSPRAPDWTRTAIKARHRLHRREGQRQARATRSAMRQCRARPYQAGVSELADHRSPGQRRQDMATTVLPWTARWCVASNITPVPSTRPN